jgi:tRNA C32,U32 (ribose-2'-O)-methylase TrmJ
MKAGLAYWIQCETALEASQAMSKEQVEQQPPAFTRATQNMAATAALLDVLPVPSTDMVGEVYEWLKSILGTAAMPQEESSLLYQV